MTLSRRPPSDPLLEGYARFRRDVWPGLADRYRAVARRPASARTMVIACADARVDPEAIFGAGPGEILVVRNVANIVPPYEPDERSHGTSAALEYAVRILKVRRVVVLGHSRCDGVRGLMEGAGRHGQDFLEPWLCIAEPVLWPVPVEVDERELQRHFEHRVVGLSLANLRTFPWIAERLRSGSLSLTGYWFDIGAGALWRVTDAGAEPVEPDQAGFSSRRLSR